MVFPWWEYFFYSLPPVFKPSLELWSHSFCHVSLGKTCMDKEIFRHKPRAAVTHLVNEYITWNNIELCFYAGCLFTYFLRHGCNRGRIWLAGYSTAPGCKVNNFQISVLGSWVIREIIEVLKIRCEYFSYSNFFKAWIFWHYRKVVRKQKRTPHQCWKQPEENRFTSGLHGRTSCCYCCPSNRLCNTKVGNWVQERSFFLVVYSFAIKCKMRCFLLVHICLLLPNLAKGLKDLCDYQNDQNI